MSDLGILHILASLLTLIFLEIILGIDNLVFIAIAASRLPTTQQAQARQWGLIFALVTRLLLLASLNWLAGLTQPLFTLADFTVSSRDIILFVGGLFLLYKGTKEVHDEVAHDTHTELAAPRARLKMVILQIAILDIVFSLDSVITAIGMTSELWIMATAIIIAIIVMILTNSLLCEFIEQHPSLKVLALSFIIMVGMVLCADGLHFHVPRAYIYFAIGFSLTVETLNIIRGRKRSA